MYFQFTVIDQLLNTADPICIQLAYQIASEITKRCSDSGQKINYIEDQNIVLRVLEHFFLNQNTCKSKLTPTKAEINLLPPISVQKHGKFGRSFSEKSLFFCGTLDGVHFNGEQLDLGHQKIDLDETLRVYRVDS